MSQHDFSLPLTHSAITLLPATADQRSLANTPFDSDLFVYHGVGLRVSAARHTWPGECEAVATLRLTTPGPVHEARADAVSLVHPLAERVRQAAADTPAAQAVREARVRLSEAVAAKEKAQATLDELKGSFGETIDAAKPSKKHAGFDRAVLAEAHRLQVEATAAGRRVGDAQTALGQAEAALRGVTAAGWAAAVAEGRKAVEVKRARLRKDLETALTQFSRDLLAAEFAGRMLDGPPDQVPSPPRPSVDVGDDEGDDQDEDGQEDGDVTGEADEGDGPVAEREIAPKGLTPAEEAAYAAAMSDD